ncbi:tandem-type lipoprotein, partial [Staphylococcus epidermidis]|uniref:tandem-type lipoprotein n=1 Tax=Staphylococcus epidermidis TaxID=1282 RepID=UPI0021B42144
MNPNTTTPKPYFLIHNIKHHTNATPIHNQNKYPLKINHNNIFPTNPISHHNLKKQIQNFKFFVQYPNFKNLNHYKNPDILYNP